MYLLIAETTYHQSKCKGILNRELNQDISVWISTGWFAKALFHLGAGWQCGDQDQFQLGSGVYICKKLKEGLSGKLLWALVGISHVRVLWVPSWRRGDLSLEVIGVEKDVLFPIINWVWMSEDLHSGPLSSRPCSSLLRPVFWGKWIGTWKSQTSIPKSPMN